MQCQIMCLSTRLSMRYMFSLVKTQESLPDVVIYFSLDVLVKAILSTVSISLKKLSSG